MNETKKGTFSEIRLKDIIGKTDPRLDQDAVTFITEAIQKGTSYDRAEMRLNLQGRVPPICRNHFYKVRRRVLDKLNQNLTF